MNINDIFTIEQYDEAYAFVSTHEYTTIKDLGNGQYQIIQLHIPTEEELAQKEKERISKLCLTRGDVFRGIYLAKQITKAQIRQIIVNNETISEAKRELALIDFDDSLNFYRGIELVEVLGNALGFSSDQLDRFFETNDYKELLK